MFSDPHLPWLRRAEVEAEPASAASTPERSLLPWMSLVVFDVEELSIQPPQATSIGLESISSYDADKLPSNGAFSMAVGDYLSNIKNRIYYEAGYSGSFARSDFNALKASKDATSIIFPTKSRVQQIFGSREHPEILQSQKVRISFE